MRVVVWLEVQVLQAYLGGLKKPIVNCLLGSNALNLKARKHSASIVLVFAVIQAFQGMKNKLLAYNQVI